MKMTALLNLMILVSAIYSHEVYEEGLFKTCYYTVPGGTYAMSVRVHTPCPRIMKVEM